MQLFSSIWASESPFLSGRGGRSSDTSTGSLSKMLALECSINFTTKKSDQSTTPKEIKATLWF